MGGKSKSETAANTTTTTTNTQNLDTTSIGLDNTEFGAVAGGNLSITQNTTDQGAIEKSFDAIKSNTDSALDFGGKAVTAVSDANAKSLDFGLDTVDHALLFGSKALDSVTQTASQSSSTLANAIDKAAAASRSDSSQSLNEIVKYATYAIGAIVAGVTLYLIFKRKG